MRTSSDLPPDQPSRGAPSAALGALIASAVATALLLGAVWIRGLPLAGWAWLVLLVASECALAATWLSMLSHGLTGRRLLVCLPLGLGGCFALGMAILAQGSWVLAQARGLGFAGGGDGLAAVADELLGDPRLFLGRAAALTLPAAAVLAARSLRPRLRDSVLLGAPAGWLGCLVLRWVDPTALGWLVGIRVSTWTSVPAGLVPLCVLAPVGLLAGFVLGDALDARLRATPSAPRPAARPGRRRRG